MAAKSISASVWTRAGAGALALLMIASIVTADQTPAAEIATMVEQGRMLEAADRASQWAEAEPGNTQALHTSGSINLLVGRYRQAEESWRSLLFYSPNDADLRLMLGRVLVQRGLHAEAREQFEAAIQLGTRPHDAFVELARVAMLDGEDPGEMLSAAEVALSVAPDHAPAHAVMGAVMRELGHYDSSVEALRRAREIDGRYAPALFDLGLTWARLGHEARATRVWQRYIELAPESPQAWLLRNRLVIAGVEQVIDRVTEACYSPDGSRIAFRTRGPGGWGVYTIPADGPAEEKRLWSVGSDATIQSLTWSPDSSLIAVEIYERYVDEAGAAQWTRRVLVVSADSGEAREITSDRQLGEVTWNPGSGRLGMRHHQRGEGWRIIEVDVATGERTAIPVSDRRLPHFSPTWSSDGSMLAALRRSGALADGSFTFDLVIGPADDFASASVIYSTQEQPRRLAFSADDAAILLVLPSEVDERLSIRALPVDGSREPVLVDHMAGRNPVLSISPDGRYLLTTRDLALVRARLEGLEMQ